jgi:hypothetical protein
MKIIKLQLKVALWFSRFKISKYSSQKCDLEKLDLEKHVTQRVSNYLERTRHCRRRRTVPTGGGGQRKPGPLEIIQYSLILHGSFTFSSSFSCLFISHPHCCCSSPPQRAGP